jgi:hypothetical protein
LDGIIADVGVDAERGKLVYLRKRVKRAEGDKHLISDALDIERDPARSFGGEAALQRGDHQVKCWVLSAEC